MKDKKLLASSDLYIGIGILVVFMVLIWQISIIKVKESRIFPLVAAVIMGLSGISLVVKGLRSNDEKAKKLMIGGKQWLSLLVLFVGYLLYSKVGFYVTLFLVVSTISLINEYPLNKKKILSSLVYSLIVTIFCFICFYLILGLYTPSGLLI
ncbi:MAG: tripartite tricarboxylate transporter TctB family protein [Candidatus Ornithospirochaeta sp.]